MILVTKVAVRALLMLRFNVPNRQKPVKSRVVAGFFHLREHIRGLRQAKRRKGLAGEAENAQAIDTTRLFPFLDRQALRQSTLGLQPGDRFALAAESIHQLERPALMRGKDALIRRSRNSYILSLRSVTFTPIAVLLRNLKLEISLRDTVAIAF